MREREREREREFRENEEEKGIHSLFGKICENEGITQPNKTKKQNDRPYV